MSKGKTWPQIRRRGRSWQVDCGFIAGKRVQVSFKTRAEAEAEGARRRGERKAEGDSAYALSPPQRQQALRALEILTGSGYDLVGAAEYVRDHAAPLSARRTIDELLSDYATTKEAAGRRPMTVKSIRYRCGRFVEAFKGRTADSFSTEELETWFTREKFKGETRAGMRRALLGFFNHAIKRKAARANPANDLERPSRDDELPDAFTVDEVRKILTTAATIEPHTVPYYAIGFFAGLRTAELDGLDWREIDFENKTIKVLPATAKKRRTRFVDMADNLIAWLRQHRKTQGPIDGHRHDVDRVRRKSGVEWKPNGMRHSFASYHLAMHENAAKTALQLGHRRQEIVFDHYRQLVRKSDAEKYWTVYPDMSTGPRLS
ncbi:MAG: tyrosine-type recombinase/integrase [Candidatus Hydrogenedentes bacterium]|nr:tyrosine-type recombinase/integrase [Candidatus Hydrogenedentota bacterium]